MMLGADRPITCLDVGNPYCTSTVTTPARCDSVADDVPCNQLVSKSGNIAGSVYDGLIGGNTATDHLGRLAFSDGRTPNPVNPHGMPSDVWTAVARTTGAPSGSVVWNNLMSNPDDRLDASCSLGASSLSYFFDASLPPAPADPLIDCEDGEIDDQPVYPIPPDISYVNPPRFEISAYDCRDLRLIIVPAGTWGPKGAGPSNPRLFTITGFEIAYLLDPIVEDDTSTSGGPADGTRKGTISGGDTRLLWWGHQNNAGGTWQEGDDRTTNLAQMSAFSVRFAPNAEVVGGCPLNPVPPGLGDLLPSEVKLVAAP